MEDILDQFLTIYKNRISNNICSDILLEEVFSKLIKINCKNFNESESRISINHDIEIHLTSVKDVNLELVLNLWRSQINIYIGKNAVHYADDVDISTEADLKELNRNLSFLFYGTPSEELTYNGNDLIAFKYTFNLLDSKLIYKDRKWFNFLKNSRYRKEKKYAPWVTAPKTR